MKHTAVFTTTLSPTLLLWLNEYSRKEKTTKRAIIEKALETYRLRARKKELAESFKKAAQDIEMRNMAEEGLSDYLSQLKALEA